MQYKALMGTVGVSGLLFLSGDRDVRLPRVREAVKWIAVSIGYGAAGRLANDAHAIVRFVHIFTEWGWMMF